jgi:hypothetical protein
MLNYKKRQELAFKGGFHYNIKVGKTEKKFGKKSFLGKKSLYHHLVFFFFTDLYHLTLIELIIIN